MSSFYVGNQFLSFLVRFVLCSTTCHHPNSQSLHYNLSFIMQPTTCTQKQSRKSLHSAYSHRHQLQPALCRLVMLLQQDKHAQWTLFFTKRYCHKCFISSLLLINKQLLKTAWCPHCRVSVCQMLLVSVRERVSPVFTFLCINSIIRIF